MKVFKVILRPILFLSVLCMNQSYGQNLEIPRASPKATISQLIGVCKVGVDYGRPSARGRKILGDLVPYDKVWRAGANEATVISFNYDISVAGNIIPAGKYGLFMIPEKEKWVVIFNSEWNQWGAYHYNENKDILRVNVIPKKNTHVEICTYDFNEVTKNKGVLTIRWENFSVGIPIETETQVQTELEIKKVLSTSDNNWYNYSAAAQYYFYELKDADKSLAYIDQAIALNAPNPAPWMLKSQILASQTNYQDAITLAEEAITVCKKHNMLFEIRENEENIEKWKKL